MGKKLKLNVIFIIVLVTIFIMQTHTQTHTFLLSSGAFAINTIFRKNKYSDMELTASCECLEFLKL